MDFNHSEDRQLLAEALSRYLRESYPFSDRVDAALSATGFSRDRWRELHDLGAVATLLEPEVGGCGGSGFDILAVFESLGHALVVEPLLPIAMVAPVLGNHPDVAQSILDGKQIVVPAFDETGNRYDPVEIETHARRSADGWLVSGRKTVVAFANSADQFVVSARTSGRPGDRTGLSLFLIPATAPGCVIDSYSLTEGGAAGTVTLDDVHVPRSDLVCEEGCAINEIELSRATGIVALGAEALGIMGFMKAATIEHLRTRHQFGRPLGKFQALQHRLATCLLEMEQARSAVINVAARLDAPAALREITASAAKYTIGRVGTLVAEEAIQLHGGMGMTWELPLAHYAKRLIMIGHQLGDEDYHLGRYMELGDAEGAAELEWQ